MARMLGGVIGGIGRGTLPKVGFLGMMEHDSGWRGRQMILTVVEKGDWLAKSDTRASIEGLWEHGMHQRLPETTGDGDRVKERQGRMGSESERKGHSSSD